MINAGRVAALAIAVFMAMAAGAQTYYLDSVAGNDSLSGTTPATAWKSLGKVNATTFLPGQRILLKRGGVWAGQLYPKGSGTAGNPIVVGTYSTGNVPLINTGGSFLSSVRLSNQEYWELDSLELTNQHPTDSTSTRYGVYVTANDIGAVRYLIFRNLKVHNVNGDPTVKTCGGIFFEVLGSVTPTWFDSVVVEGCDVYDVSPVGIANTSTWATRTLTTNTSWYPSVRMFIRNNSIRRTVRNGMIIRVARHAVIEHNVFQECARTESGNALFTFNCDSTIMQFNEAFLTRFNAGDEDAAGFDGDYRCKSTIIQYNYSHDNEYGGIVVVSDGTGATTFNDGAVVRYNVLKDNLNHIIRTSGNVTNTTVYNNTIYSGASLGAVKVLYHKSWGGYSDNTRYHNNIFEILTPGSTYDLGSSTNNIFDYNLFHGIHPASEPGDPHKITLDPAFAAPDSAGNGWLSAAGFRLEASSPAINSGTTLPGHSGQDYLGNPVPFGLQVDRGAFEYQDSVPAPPQGGIRLDGGFEGQTPFGSLTGTTSITTGGGVQSATWTVGLTATGTEAVTDNPGLARTGSRYASFGNIGNASAKRFQSPTAPDSAIHSNSSYIIQFYYRTTGGSAPTNLQGGISPDGTSQSGINQYALVSPMTATGGTWQKTTCVVTSASSANSPRYGLGHVRFNGNSIVDIDIDDFVVYEGTSVDDAAPDPPLAAVAGSPTASTLTVHWAPPSTGVDGGEYLVARGTSDPVILPHVNGVYAAGNTLAPGDTVAYVGADTTFVDSGLAPGQLYFYRIYTSDKAHNYSAGATASGVTFGGTKTSAQSGDWRFGTTWVGGVPPTPNDDVVILTGHTVVVDTTDIPTHSITVQTGARLWANSPRTSPRYLRVSGSTVMNNGTIGGSADALSFECLTSVTFQGAGVDSICRIRPAAGVTGITMAIDKDMTIVYNGQAGTGGAGVYLAYNANENITLTVTPGHTLTFLPGSRLSVSPNLNQTPTAMYATNATFNINGVVALNGGSFGVETFTGKTTTVNVNGTITVGQSLVARTSLSPPGSVIITVNNGGVLHASGSQGAVADLLACTTVIHGSFLADGPCDVDLGTQTVVGSGTFSLGPGATLSIGSPNGIAASGATGNVQTAVRNFSSEGSYRYAAETAQITGTGLPSAVARLTIDDSAGVTLTSATAVADTLLLVRGDLHLNGNTVVLSPTGYLVESTGNTITGTGGAITTMRNLVAPAGEDVGGLGVAITSAANLGTTTITRGHAVQSGGGNVGIARYFDILPATNSGLNAALVLKYEDSELNGLPETRLVLFRSSNGGVGWVPGGGVVNGVSNTIALGGIDHFSRWTAADSSWPLSMFSVGVPVAPGWNIISNPVETTEDSVSQLYPTAAFSYAFAFDPASGYESHYRMLPGAGYWEKFSAGATQNLSGTRRLLDSIAVQGGWNMIGSISDTVDTSAVVSVPPGLRVSEWFGYQSGYDPVTHLLPGSGYWVKTSGAGTFVLAGSGKALKVHPADTESLVDPQPGAPRNDSSH